MTYFAVKNGTHAGWRITRPEPVAWICSACKKALAPHWAKCPDCGAGRG